MAVRILDAIAYAFMPIEVCRFISPEHSSHHIAELTLSSFQLARHIIITDRRRADATPARR